MNTNDRTENGRFSVGNPGGPGRPRRTVEREYLAALSDCITVDDWREIVRTAVDAAKNGDVKSRDWLSRYLLGDKPITLTQLAADEFQRIGVEQDILEGLAGNISRRRYSELSNVSGFHDARKLLERVEK